MSKIALSGPASGTATYTISAPTGATDRTITLPDQTATLITNSSGVLDIGSGQLYKDASGNLGIGTSSPGNKLVTASSATNSKIEIQNTSTAASTSKTSALQFTGADTVGTLKETGDIYVTPADNNYVGSNMVFYTRGSDSVSERARIDSSGNLLVGTTSTTVNPGIALFNISNAQIAVGHANGTASGQNYAYFQYNGSTIGSITQNGTTAVAYNTTSDYRLKENIQPISGALARVAALKPCTYTWKNAPDEVGEGFIAHELADICPQAVTGEKDAVNEDGSINPQSIDTSFLVATLTAAIQEQQAIITALTARVTALEGTQP